MIYAGGLPFYCDTAVSFRTKLLFLH